MYRLKRRPARRPARANAPKSAYTTVTDTPNAAWRRRGGGGRQVTRLTSQVGPFNSRYRDILLTVTDSQNAAWRAGRASGLLEFRFRGGESGLLAENQIP